MDSGRDWLGGEPPSRREVLWELVTTLYWVPLVLIAAVVLIVKAVL